MQTSLLAGKLPKQLHRINVNIDYFNNNVDGLILDAPTASSLGIPNNSISKNVGSLSNKGWEFQIDADAIRSASGFKWNINLNLSFIKNEITGLNKGSDGKDQDIFAGNFANNNYTIIRVGESIGSLYGYQSAGVNPANGYPMFTKGDGQTVQRNPNTGTYGFYTEGSQGFVADTKATLNALDVAQGGDRRVLGSTVPKWYGGFINKFSYKGFDLELFLRFSGGNSIMNVTRQTSLLGQDFMNNGREILDRWQKPGDVTDVPIVVARRGNIINLDGNVTSRFVEKGDFLRMQNIVIGYTLPQNILAKTEGKSFPIRSLRVYAQVQNAFTFTKYKGADPEINAGTGNANGGVDFNTSPQIRTFTFGLNVGL
jgi:TonB-dependent starch-binding outer membrane protein SusC